MLFLAQTDGGTDITNWMALRKFGFTRDGGFWNVFVDDLEQNGGEIRSRRDLHLGRVTTNKKRQQNIQNTKNTGLGTFCPDTIHRPVSCFCYETPARDELER